jgi:hypothetical protein
MKVPGFFCFENQIIKLSGLITPKRIDRACWTVKKHGPRGRLQKMGSRWLAGLFFLLQFHRMIL